MANQEQLVDYLKRVATDLHDAQQRLREVEARDRQPIAIVGMACRFPGGADTPEALWELVSAGRDAVSAMPDDRGWDPGMFNDSGETGTSYVREGGFVRGMADFDADFFDISPREALAMDPQQRLLLETAWEAIERARIDVTSLRATRTGVFIGGSTIYYAGTGAGAPQDVAGYMATGLAASSMSGRISYTFGFEGPSFTVDTACSSSGVALHLAVQSLRKGESSLALAGGVCVMATPGTFLEFSKLNGLAADGRCKAFAASADGFGPGEGVGVLLVERLADAQRLGHPVLAVIRGSAINQDGASNGLTAPHGPAQERVIRAALADAQLSARDIDVVEAHGTGTSLGDPIEAQALIAAYGRRRGEGAPLWLGSVKSNIGHTQAAAGMAGVIKMVQALRHGVLPSTLHVDEPTHQVDWSEGTVKVLTEARPWPGTGGPRRAGVSSFGMSGTNAHVILEEAPEASNAAEPAPATELPVVPWLVSGRGEAALRAQAARLRDFLTERPEAGPTRVGLALAGSRAAQSHRAAVVAADRDALLAGLASLADGVPAGHVVTGAPSPGEAVFVFPGQGSQWAGMALDLADASPVFAEHFRRCAQAVERHTEYTVESVLRGEPGAPSLERVDVVQPVLWVVMVALAELWRSYGVEPAAVVGHSQGEIAAACVAGVLSVEDAARVVALRSQALPELSGRGGMASVALPVQQVGKHLEGWDGRLGVAAVNGPSSTVVSGDADALEELLETCEADGVRARRVPVDYASHCAHVDALRDRLAEDLAGIAPKPGSVPLYSTVTGQRIDGTAMDAGYWFTNLRQQVRFEEATRALLDDGHSVFIECSPHPVLVMGAQETVDEAGVNATALGTLRRDEGGWDRFLLALAQAHVHGVEVAWGRVFPDGTGPADLPTYAFQRRRYWLDATDGGAGDPDRLGLAAAGHPLLGAVTVLAEGDEVVLTGRLGLDTHPWLADHAVAGAVLVPGALFVELAVRAGDEVGCDWLEELVLASPLVLPDQGGTHLQLVVGRPDGEGRRTLNVYARPADESGSPWLRHATGTLAPGPDAEPYDLAQWPPEGTEPVPVDGCYDQLAEAGYRYGPAFRCLRAVYRRGTEVFAEVVLPEEQRGQAAAFGVHPALLDGALQASGLPEVRGGQGRMALPFAWNGVSLAATGAELLRVRLAPVGDDGMSVHATDASGRPVISIDALVTRPFTPEQLQGGGEDIGDALFRVTYTPLTGAPAGGAIDGWAAVATGTTPTCYGAPRYDDLDALAAAVDGGLRVPPVTLLPCEPRPDDTDLPGAVRHRLGEVLHSVQRWLADERFADSRLVVVTRGAVAASDGEDVTDLAHAPVWGLIRSAQSEHPDRLVLVDLDGPALPGALAPAVAAGEQRIVVRNGTVRVSALVPAASGAALTLPEDPHWRLDITGPATLDNLALVAAEEPPPLAPGRIRVRVRAAGVNFRDVLIALGMYPGDAVIRGSEGAGVVVEVAPDVTSVAVGDRVMGMFQGAFGSTAVADARSAVPVPPGWTDEQAAAVPIAFLTAWHGLVDLAGLKAGESVLVHAAAGGVGMAAVQIARHLGAEVYATASPAKHHVLEAMGIDAAHRASSRDLDFEGAFPKVDVVLNSLAGEFTDASLRLLADGGRFVELGLTDVRDPEQLAETHRGARYRVLDLGAPREEGLGRILTEVLARFARDELTHPPVRVFDIRRARDAFRLMSRAAHIGKIVLTLPRPLEPEGTVLVTGGTGTLGGLIARHLVTRHGIRHVLLTGRQGPQAPGAAELREELTALGATVTVEVCDIGDRDAVAGLLAGVPDAHPLTGVVHCAGVLDDGMVDSLTPERLARVLRPKADGAAHLHELTKDADLAMFVMFSSIVGVNGNPSQANYAAASAFLDALAHHRRAHGLPGQSLAWGMWEETSRLTGRLDDGDLERIRQAGMDPLPTEQALALFDRSYAAGDALLVPIRQATAASGSRPAAGRARARRVADSGAAGTGGPSLAERVTALPEAEREDYVLEALCAHMAAVLGHGSADEIAHDRTFKELGFDSLTAVELRNRLSAATGLRLPATLIFDFAHPLALAQHLRERIAAPADPAGSAPTDPAGSPPPDPRESRVREVLAAVPLRRLEESGLLDALLRLGEEPDPTDSTDTADTTESADSADSADFASMELEELVDMALRNGDS
ncbi:type I polyketide synthase [Streptomyces sp. DSM 41529]|uniref:JenA11 n=2 Tax=Streptomyces TaxID=1883 RepID=A0A5B8RLE5_STRHY|nr:type I polyketide synthase [Streptomyces sp. DSM 41529]MDT0544767.1 type I polyketide synthase [Streptomyces sp. DSM 41529]QEA08906.1 JenA11 [Streptomyces hygroscopicus]